MTDGIARDGLKHGDLAVITGAGGGFGRAFALRFADMGARLALWDIDGARGGETLRLVEAQGGKGAFYAVDLADAAAIVKAAEATLADLGRPTPSSTTPRPIRARACCRWRGRISSARWRSTSRHPGTSASCWGRR